MLRLILRCIAILVLLLGLYLCFWPVPIDPVAWHAPQNLGYVGPFAQNQRLAELRMLPLGDDVGPEDIAPGPDGALYVALEHGRIARITPPPAGSGHDPDAWTIAAFANTQGRPLGLAFAPPGAALPADWSAHDLVVADAYRGLLRITASGEVEVLTERAADSPIALADGVVVDRRGRIYVTDASTEFGTARTGDPFRSSVLEIFDHRGTGRLLMYDPHTKATEVLRTGLCFPNGVALASDERSLLIAETGNYRIVRHRLDRPDSNQDSDQRSVGPLEVVLDNLPGYPDNIRPGPAPSEGATQRYWVGLTKPRSALLDWMSDKPFWRRMAVRMPDALQPIPPAYGHVFAFDEAGQIVTDLQDPGGAYPSTTGATEFGGRLYIQSLHAPGLGYLEPAPQ